VKARALDHTMDQSPRAARAMVFPVVNQHIDLKWRNHGLLPFTNAPAQRQPAARATFGGF
jgi:hypothetical protein